MRRSGAPLFLWGILLAALCGVAVVAFTIPDPETPALLGGSAGLAAVAGVLLAIGRAAPTDGRAPRALPDISPPTVWLAGAIAVAATGAVLGLWLALIGAGMALIGLGSLVRELRAQRDSARRTPEG